MQTEYSDIGNKNLDTLDKAENFTNWMYEQVKPYLKGKILEIGSGSGTYSKKIIRDFASENIFLSDLDPDYITKLQKQFQLPQSHIQTLNLEKQEEFAKFNTTFDSAFALNVLEHVEHDELAFKNIYNALTPNGSCIILVPAHKFLFNRIDTAVGHFRRYSKEELSSKTTKAGFIIEKIFYFNALSIPGWYLNGNILKKAEVDGNLVGFYNAIIPPVRLVEKYILQKKIGISLIAILKKP